MRSCSSCVVMSGVMAMRSTMATGPVSRPSSICMTMTPVSASPAMMARWMGAAPRQRGRSEPWRLRQPRGRLQHRLRQDEAIGDDHRDIGAERGEVGLRRLIAQGARREDGNGEAVGEAVHRRLLLVHAAAGGLRRAGIDRDDLVALAKDLGEGGHGEIRRAHEDDAQAHAWASRRAALANFFMTRSRFSRDR